MTRSSQSQILAAAASIVLLSRAPSALADWTAHADFSSCPRNIYTRTEGHEAPVATEAECKAQIERAKRGDPAVCIRYWCQEGAASGGTSSAEPGHQLDATIERAIEAGVSGDISGTDAAALVGVGVLGNALLAGMTKTPEQQQQERQQAEAQQRLLAEQARQQAAAEEERKNRLLGEMQGVEQGTDLQLMTDDTDASPQTGADAGTGGELALMTDDDDTRGIMAKRKAPQPKRNQPPATRVNQGPYTTPVPGGAPARAAPGNAGANGQVVAMNAATPEPANAGPTDRESVAKGREDGNACRQRSPGTHCGVLKGEALSSCQRSYNLGYDAGKANEEQRLKGEGAAAAAADKAKKTNMNGGPQNQAMRHAEAQGSCGNIFVNAYNQAFSKP